MLNNLHPCLLNTISGFLEISEKRNLKIIDRKTNKSIILNKKKSLEDILSGKFNKIPSEISLEAARLALNHMKYDIFFKIIPFITENSVFSYNIFNRLTLLESKKFIFLIEKYPHIMENYEEYDDNWFIPFSIIKWTFGCNLEVFRYALELGRLRGLDYLIEEDSDFFNYQDDDDYIAFNALLQRVE
jgi:hypothetical protein